MIILKDSNHNQIKTFRKWKDLADWTEKNLPYGEYWGVVKPLRDLTGIRKIRYSKGEFWVEHRGYI